MRMLRKIHADVNFGFIHEIVEGEIPLSSLQTMSQNKKRNPSLRKKLGFLYNLRDKRLVCPFYIKSLVRQRGYF